MFVEPATLLYVIRLRFDDEVGLAMEDVTRFEHEIRAYEYSCVKLADIIRRGRFMQFSVALPDMERTVNLSALTDTHSVYEFKEFCQFVDGYTYAPFGKGARSLGAQSPDTPAWLMPHRDGPVLLWKGTNRQAHDAVQHWMASIMDIDISPRWPGKAKADDVLVVPAAMEQFRTDTGRGQRYLRKVGSRGLKLPAVPSIT
jgi:hypothetical protein